MARKSKKQTQPEVTRGPSLAEIQAERPHVQSIAAVGASGRITRVVIACQGCQDGSHVDDCSQTREIATQDVFQVFRSVACQRMFARIRRRKTPQDAPAPPKQRKRRTTKARKAAPRKRSSRKRAASAS